jgi:hypothetical protein
VLREDFVFEDEILPNNNLGSAVYQYFEGEKGLLARSKGPIRGNLPYRFFITTISELEDILRPWSGIDIKAVALGVPGIGSLLAGSK